jgi:hypothetical protein
MQPKPWWQSRTLWLNIAAIVVVAIGAVVSQAGVLNIPSNVAAQCHAPCSAISRSSSASGRVRSASGSVAQ